MQRTTFFKSALSTKTLLLCLGLAIGVAGCSGDPDESTPSPNVPPPPIDDKADKLSPELKTDLQAILDEVIAKKVTPGVALYVSTKQGESWSSAAGILDMNTNAAMTADVRFRSGSIMKTMIATAVLQAVEAGKLGLDDKLTARLPASITARVVNADAITVRMLLSHRSGVPEWMSDEVKKTAIMEPSHIWAIGEILTTIEKLPADFPPDAKYAYSNTNYILLGEVLEAVHGRSWREVIRENVFARAGLSQTILPNAGDIECSGCAHGYLPIDGQLLDATRVDPSMAGASGGHALISTAPDLGRFLLKLRSGDLFEKKSTVDAMFTFQAAPEEETRQVGYGFGTMKMESSGTTTIGHLGGTAGYHAFMLYVPASDRYVSGAINVNGDLGAVLDPVIARVAKR